MTAAAEPRPVEAFAGILADWLSAFTVPQELAGEMADACAAGAPWAAGVAGVAARRAGWREPEAVAWGIAVGAVAGALEAARRSLSPGPAPARAADGPALSLLAADGLIAGAHEALSSLPPDRLAAALAALDGALGDGGPWRSLGPDWPRPAWPAAMALALAPAAAEDLDGPWAGWAIAWRAAFARPGAASPESDDGRPRDDPATEPGEPRRPRDDPAAAPGDLRRLWDHPAADPADRALLEAAAAAAGR